MSSETDFAAGVSGLASGIESGFRIMDLAGRVKDRKSARKAQEAFEADQAPLDSWYDSETQAMGQGGPHASEHGQVPANTKYKSKYELDAEWAQRTARNAVKHGLHDKAIDYFKVSDGYRRAATIEADDKVSLEVKEAQLQKTLMGIKDERMASLYANLKPGKYQDPATLRDVGSVIDRKDIMEGGRVEKTEAGDLQIWGPGDTEPHVALTKEWYEMVTGSGKAIDPYAANKEARADEALDLQRKAAERAEGTAAKSAINEDVAAINEDADRELKLLDAEEKALQSKIEMVVPARSNDEWFGPNKSTDGDLVAAETQTKELQDQLDAIQKKRREVETNRRTRVEGLRTSGKSLAGSGTGGVSKAAPGSGGIPSPKTDEEYQALPPGTEYIHPDGSKRTKK